MTELFVSYETAKLLKEKGFDKSCFGGYYLYQNTPDLCIYQDENEFSDAKEIILQAPLYQQAIDWLREKHKIFIMPTILTLDTKLPTYKTGIFGMKKGDEPATADWSEDYYETTNKAIIEALKLI